METKKTKRASCECDRVLYSLACPERAGDTVFCSLFFYFVYILFFTFLPTRLIRKEQSTHHNMLLMHHYGVLVFLNECHPAFTQFFYTYLLFSSPDVLCVPLRFLLCVLLASSSCLSPSNLYSFALANALSSCPVFFRPAFHNASENCRLFNQI